MKFSEHALISVLVTIVLAGWLHPLSEKETLALFGLVVLAVTFINKALTKVLEVMYGKSTDNDPRFG